MINYQKYRDKFDAFLDEEPEIIIGNNFSRSRSQVLYEMDDVAYSEQLVDYVNDLRTDYKETIYQDFPAPVAYFLYQSEHSYDNEIHRLHLLRSVWDSVIYILYALVLGEVNSKNFSLANVRVFNNQRIRIDHTGLLNDRLGYKTEVMRKIIEHDQQYNNQLYLSSVINTNIFDILEDLNQERNSFSHIAALSAPEALDRFNDLNPQVLDLLFELDFLEDVSLLRFISNLGAATNVRFHRYNGRSLQRQIYNKTFTPAEITPFLPILNDQFILFELNGTIINSSPFIHFSTEVPDIKLCYFKSINGTTGDFIFEQIGGASREFPIQETSLNGCIHTNLGNLI